MTSVRSLRFVHFASLVGCSVAFAVPLACGSSSGGGGGLVGDSGGADTSIADSSGLNLEGGLSVPDGGFGSGTAISSIAITPATAALEVDDGDITGAKATQTFVAVATYGDGHTANYHGCTWTTDRIDIGTMIGDGNYAPTGSVGGSGNVICTAAADASSLVAKAAVSVELVDTANTATLDPTTLTQLLGATTTDTTVTKLIYPYDQTVFPRGLQAPQVMWSGGNADDVFALVLEEPGVRIISTFTTPSPLTASIPQAEWTKLMDSSKGTQLAVTLYRLDHGVGGTPFVSATETWTIADATLQGTIYYWRINGGRVVRIRPGDTAPDDFLTPPDGSTLPTNANNGGSGTVTTSCIACHNVSRDGSTLVADYNGGWSPWATFDPTTGTQGYYSNNFGAFGTLYHDGSLLVSGDSGGTTLNLADAHTGASYEPSGLQNFGTAVRPEFSPDGKWLAFSVRKDGNWLDFSTADLDIAPFDLPSKQFGAAVTLQPSTTGQVFMYPSFSPDSKYVVYMAGNAARTRNEHANLHLMGIDGTGDTVLANAASDFGTDDGAPRAFEPTFNPVSEGGYFWVVFVSTRIYGNVSTNTSEDPTQCPAAWAPGCRNKQLWVVAIDASPKPGVDPSHPAFWLPGQDPTDQNMRGDWVLDQCKAIGETCAAGFECCAGACRADATGALSCTTPPPGTCANVGEACTADGDCCNASGGGVGCIGGFCGTHGPN